jgi:hypothetical protein
MTTAQDIYWYLQCHGALPSRINLARIQLCTVSRSPKIIQALSPIGDYGLLALSHLRLHVTMLGGSSQSTWAPINSQGYDLSLSTAVDQCALRSDRTLKDTSEIVWYTDKDDDMPMASTSAVQTGRHHSSSFLLITC